MQTCRIWLITVVSINPSVLAKGISAAAITQVAVTTAAVAIAGGKIDANLFTPAMGRFCRSSEVAQSGPATNSGDGMMSVVDGWCWRWWFLDYLVSGDWFSAEDGWR